MSANEMPSSLKWVLEKGARAEIERLNNALIEAANQISDLSTRLGQAEGRLDASEMVGVVEGWKARAEKAETALEAYGRKKVREGMRRAATICDSYCAEYWETGGLDHLLAARDAILAAMEKESGE